MIVWESHTILLVKRGLMISRRRRSTGRSCRNLAERYGAWALVAGASQGLGAAYAHSLARRGMNLVLIARRKSLLDELADNLRSNCGVEVRCLAGDLATLDFLGSLEAECSGLDLGLIVYNATQAPIGEFVVANREALTRVVDVNVRAQVELLRSLLPGMLSRGRGGVILMTSLAGNQGAPRLAAYAASKAFLGFLLKACGMSSRIGESTLSPVVPVRFELQDTKWRQGKTLLEHSIPRKLSRQL